MGYQRECYVHWLTDFDHWLKPFGLWLPMVVLATPMAVRFCEAVGALEIR